MNPGDRPVMAGLSNNIEQKRETNRQINHHIHVNLKDVQGLQFSNTNDELDIYLSLYSPKTSSYISERVLMSSNKTRKDSIANAKNTKDNTGCISANNINASSAIFLDIGTLDQCRELHLVCHVLRIGKMLTNQTSPIPSNPISVMSGVDGKKSPSSQHKASCRRPFSVAAVNINRLVTRP